MSPELSPVPVVVTALSGPDTGPPLVLGPSLGTSCTTLWRDVVPHLRARHHVLVWDLPGHGPNRDVGAPFAIADLAAAVLAGVDEHLDGARFAYAGVSVGGATGLQLLLDAPDRVTRAAIVASAARIGEPDAWAERAALVRASGTGAVVEGSRGRWFAPGFADAHPEVALPLLEGLRAVDAEGYAQVCEALGAFDVRDRLGEVRAPLLELLGADDPVCPPSGPALGGTRRVLDGVAHLPPAEAPRLVAHALDGLLDGPTTALSGGATTEDVYDAGMAVRRQVLGAAHVDRATAAVEGLPEAEFQRFITQYAWGGIWTRPGLDRRTRSFITLTALMARGHDDEFAMHVRAALTNGLTEAEIVELVLQCAIYLGVPDANHALKLVRRVLDETGGS